MSLDLAVTDWNMIYFSFARLLNIDNRFAVASSDDRNKELEPEYGMYYVNNTVGRIFSNKRLRGIEIWGVVFLSEVNFQFKNSQKIKYKL